MSCLEAWTGPWELAQGTAYHIIDSYRKGSKQHFMMNESYVKRTIASLDDLVDSKLMHAKRVEFK